MKDTTMEECPAIITRVPLPLLSMLLLLPLPYHCCQHRCYGIAHHGVTFINTPHWSGEKQLQQNSLADSLPDSLTVSLIDSLTDSLADSPADSLAVSHVDSFTVSLTVSLVDSLTDLHPGFTRLSDSLTGFCCSFSC